MTTKETCARLRKMADLLEQLPDDIDVLTVNAYHGFPSEVLLHYGDLQALAELNGWELRQEPLVKEEGVFLRMDLGGIQLTEVVRAERGKRDDK